MAKLNLEIVSLNDLVVANAMSGQERVGSGLAASATQPALLSLLPQVPAADTLPPWVYPTDKVGFTSPRAGRSVRRSHWSVRHHRTSVIPAPNVRQSTARTTATTTITGGRWLSLSRRLRGSSVRCGRDARMAGRGEAIG